MALPNLYSRRARQARKNVDDVYVYDHIPKSVRVQMLQVFSSVIGDYQIGYNAAANEVYDFIVRLMREELGVFSLNSSSTINAQRELSSWLDSTPDVERVVDCIELMMTVLDGHVRNAGNKFGKTDVDFAIGRANARLMEACVGYQYQSGQMIRFDSTVMHAEVVVPSLHLLADPDFASAEGEYLKAHAEYRDGQYETCIIECAKAFESVLKVVAVERGWPVKSSDPAKKLLDAAYGAGFIEPALQAEFTALRSLLEGAVPTVRNKMSGHGAGVTPRNVPQHFAALQLHQTGAALLFLVQHHRANP
ncbi:MULTISPECIES: STM4504/CBY_0614 family protein [Brevundimonas]|uniref:Abortive infection protein-like C-terminal domain-containing protein n=2 Tax=Brevundimonas TaxID=41275 RepID=A0A4Y9RXS6_9CAUL|nr:MULTISPECIES: hypothetical protein [Brevundimonas]QSF53846.1 hypothetical protein JX001_13900 [Brevundimonas fontaquae]TFW12585.1 hypothetical protein EGY25_11345 [Brevundimonas intermedia]